MFKLQTVDLCKSYRGRKVVDALDLEVGQGEVVGLLGPNGAGKTTTFYILVGLARPDSGRVLLDGEDITDLPMYLRARSGISYLPQEPSAFRQLTVEENLLAVLETLPLKAEQQRDCLDEPFSGIDPLEVVDIQKIITDLSRARIGILITDHNVPETLAVADRAYILHSGRILCAGTPSELSTDAEVRRIYLGNNFRLN